MSDVLAIGGALLMVLSKTAISFEMIMVGRFIYGINSGEPMRKPITPTFTLLCLHRWLLYHPSTLFNLTDNQLYL